MIEKIFTKLKQGYSHLGLGDAILRSQAESLASLGFVTDDNIDIVVNGQKGFLESLQKSNDNRVTEAIKKAKKEAEDEAKKKADEAKKRAEDDAKKKAEEEARLKAEEARKQAEEAKRQAEIEAERKRKEELEKNGEIPQWYKDKMLEQEERAKQEREALEAKIAELVNYTNTSKTSHDAILKKLTEDNKTLKASLQEMIQAEESAKAEKAKRERTNMILNKAKELGIPQTRIDEGFAIAEDADEASIGTYLSTVAKNARANQLPSASKFTMSGETTSKEELDKIADLIVVN